MHIVHCALSLCTVYCHCVVGVKLQVCGSLSSWFSPRPLFGHLPPEIMLAPKLSAKNSNDLKLG